ncbi:hypothetical protein WG947_07605 [Pontibacter sp. H259]|uniref:hypothetical protein n=1 Tax=Pontibacter sp. H259 TaxID=3133421 RepID=UPI0030BE90E9
MVRENFALMNELYGLSVGLQQANTLILNQAGEYLECGFLQGGLVIHTVAVHDKVLAAALRQECVMGILEGPQFMQFKNTFSLFSLRVKSRKIYLELKADGSQVSAQGRAVA